MNGYTALQVRVDDGRGSDGLGTFPHGADIGVRGIGATRGEAFEQAALALTAVIVDPAAVAPNVVVEIRCQAPDDEMLLADWLNALIYEMATRNMLFGRFGVCAR